MPRKTGNLSITMEPELMNQLEKRLEQPEMLKLYRLNISKYIRSLIRKDLKLEVE